MKKVFDIVNVSFKVERIEGIDVDLEQLAHDIVSPSFDNGIYSAGRWIDNEVNYSVEVSPSVEIHH